MSDDQLNETERLRRRVLELERKLQESDDREHRTVARRSWLLSRLAQLAAWCFFGHSVVRAAARLWDAGRRRLESGEPLAGPELGDALRNFVAAIVGRMFRIGIVSAIFTVFVLIPPLLQTWMIARQTTLLDRQNDLARQQTELDSRQTNLQLVQQINRFDEILKSAFKDKSDAWPSIVDGPLVTIRVIAETEPLLAARALRVFICGTDLHTAAPALEALDGLLNGTLAAPRIEIEAELGPLSPHVTTMISAVRDIRSRREFGPEQRAGIILASRDLPALVVNALGFDSLADSTTVEAIAKYLDDRYPSALRNDALRALARHGAASVTALDRIVAQLEDDDARSGALEALRAIGLSAKSAISTLRSAPEQMKPRGGDYLYAELEIARTLGSIDPLGRFAVPALERLDNSEFMYHFRNFGPHAAAAASWVRERTEYESDERKLSDAVQTLAAIDDTDKTVEWIDSKTSVGSPQLQMAGNAALAQIASPKAIAILAARLHSEETRLSTAMAVRIGRDMPASLLNPLMVALELTLSTSNAGDWSTRDELLSAILQLVESTSEQFVELRNLELELLMRRVLLLDGAYSAKAAAAAIISRLAITDDAVIQRSRDLANEEGGGIQIEQRLTFVEAVVAMTHSTSGVVDTLKSAATAPTSETRYRVARLLRGVDPARIESDEAQMLFELAGDGAAYVAAAAIRSLEIVIPEDRLMQRVERYLSSSSSAPVVRIAAEATRSSCTNEFARLMVAMTGALDEGDESACRLVVEIVTELSRKKVALDVALVQALVRRLRAVEKVNFVWPREVLGAIFAAGPDHLDHTLEPIIESYQYWLQRQDWRQLERVEKNFGDFGTVGASRITRYIAGSRSGNQWEAPVYWGRRYAVARLLGASGKAASGAIGEILSLQKDTDADVVKAAKWAEAQTERR